jgi:hypothetical protein
MEVEFPSLLTFRCIAIRVGIGAWLGFGGECSDSLNIFARVNFGIYVPLLKYLYNIVSIVNRSDVAASSCIQRRLRTQQRHVTCVKCKVAGSDGVIFWTLKCSGDAPPEFIVTSLLAGRDFAPRHLRSTSFRQNTKAAATKNFLQTETLHKSKYKESYRIISVLILLCSECNALIN